MRCFFLAVNVEPGADTGIINPGNKRMTAEQVVDLLNALTREVNYLRTAVHNQKIETRREPSRAFPGPDNEPYGCPVL